MISQQEFDDAMTDLVAAEAEIERLRAALELYGDHLYECDLKEGKDCSCGYEQALTPNQRSRPPEEPGGDKQK